MLTFVGPSDLPVDHIDARADNNRLDNLEYVTTQENNIRRSERQRKAMDFYYEYYDKIQLLKSIGMLP